MITLTRVFNYARLDQMIADLPFVFNGRVTLPLLVAETEKDAPNMDMVKKNLDKMMALTIEGKEDWSEAVISALKSLHANKTAYKEAYRITDQYYGDQRLPLPIAGAFGELIWDWAQDALKTDYNNTLYYVSRIKRRLYDDGNNPQLPELRTKTAGLLLVVAEQATDALDHRTAIAAARHAFDLSDNSPDGLLKSGQLILDILSAADTNDDTFHPMEVVNSIKVIDLPELMPWVNTTLQNISVKAACAGMWDLAIDAAIEIGRIGDGYPERYRNDENGVWLARLAGKAYDDKEILTALKAAEHVVHFTSAEDVVNGANWITARIRLVKPAYTSTALAPRPPSVGG